MSGDDLRRAADVESDAGASGGDVGHGVDRGGVAGALLHLSHRLARARSVREVADVAADGISRVVEPEAAGVLLWDAEAGRLRVLSTRGLPSDLEELASGLELSVEQHPELQEAVRIRHALVFTRESEFRFVREALEAFGVTAGVVAAVRARDQLLGFLTATFSDETEATVRGLGLEYLDGLADLTATAFDVAREAEESRRRGETTETLLDLARELAGVRSAGEVAQRVAAAVPRVIRADASAVLLVDPEKGLLGVSGMWGWPQHLAEDVGAFEIPPDGTPLLREIFERREPVYATTDLDDEVVAAVFDTFETEAALVVPIVARHDILGLVAAVERGARPGEVPAETTERLLGLADEAATALDNARLITQLRSELRARGRSEQELREARGVLEHIITSGPIVTFRGTTHGFRITFVSENLERILGYRPEEFLESNWLGYVHPSDRDAVWDAVRELGDGGQVGVETRFRFADGSWHWMAVHLRAGPADASGHREVLGYAWDRTEQREAEELYRIISETVSDTAFSYRVADGRLELEWVTGAWERVTGYPVDPLPSDLFVSIAHPDDLPAIRDAEARVVAGHHSVVEVRVIARSGETRWLRVYATPILGEDERAARVYGAAQDVTERRRAEAALRESESRLRGLVEAAPVAIVAFDAEGRVRLWNPGAERIFGWSGDEVLGQPAPFVPPELRQEAAEMGEELLAGRRVDNVETRRRCRDGSTVHVAISAAPLLAADGELAGIMTVITDISSRLELEQQLQQAEKMSAIGRLAGGVAHDFNNLLTSMLGNAELLLEDAGGDELVGEYAREMKTAVQQASALTEQMLMFSRHRPLDVVVLDANEVVRSTSALLARLIGEDVVLDVRTGDEPAWVRIGESQLQQVLLNLGVNSRDAMPDGGRIWIEVRTEGEPVPGAVVVRISDDGPGIDESARRHIFEPFFTTKESGTGLGLAVVYGIVDNAGGRVDVRSEAGVGTSFAIRLPLASPPEGEGRDASEEPGRVGGSERVLLVEDEERVRRLARRGLERHGYEVLEAADGRQALDAVDSVDSLHAAVTDLVMPEVGGTQLAGRLRERWPNLPVVYVSGYSDQAVDDARLPVSTTAYLQKPFTPTRLAEVVRSVIDAPL